MELKNIRNQILNTIFPQFCLNCHKQGMPICRDCLSLIELSEYSFCPYCNIPKRVFNEGVCAKHQHLHLNGLFSATEYNQNLVKNLIHKFKYPPYLKTLGPYLAYLIIAHISLTKNNLFQRGGENFIFIPIPIHEKKRKKRDYNQSEILSQELSQTLNIPQQTNILFKTKKTDTQTNLTKEQRVENIKDAFTIKTKNPQDINIDGKIVLLVDDVFTTGATMIEASKTLKKAKPKEIWGVTIAREPKRH
ncbi:MAG: ComF family protein [Parcubacteria group bacterium]|nr:ComF family protein [Parcubacteria group bacterium]